MSTQAQNDKMSERQTRLPHHEKWFRALVENSSDAIALISPDGAFLYISPAVTKVAGYTPDELLGRSGFDFIPKEYTPTAMAQFEDVMRIVGKTKTIEHPFLHKNGMTIWVESAITNFLQEPDIAAIVSNFRNVTERKQAEHRQYLLNEVSNLLVSSLDQHITLKQIASLLVPSLGDYCRIAVLDDNGQIKDVVANHIDPGKIALVQALYEQYKDRTASTHGVRRLLERGEPELLSVVSEDILQPLKDNPALLQIVDALGLKSYMGMPLIARGKVVGAITFSSIQSYRHYTMEDVIFAQELARRIALALDNLRLYQAAQTEIAERRQVEMQLRQSEERKDAFIRMASHELKTPITSLKGFATILQRRLLKQGDEQGLAYITKIDSQVNKLTKLINDLLDVSKIQTGKLTYQEERFEIVTLVQEIVENIQGTTQTHVLDVRHVELADVVGDRDRLGQVIINLLTNAIKYSPQAKRVVINVEREADNVLVSVQDFGIGISPANQERIFEQFYQINDPEEKTYPGLGIGLYISSEIIQRHNGRLWVESSKGQGSIFRFAIPRAQDENQVSR